MPISSHVTANYSDAKYTHPISTITMEDETQHSYVDMFNKMPTTVSQIGNHHSSYINNLTTIPLIKNDGLFNQFIRSCSKIFNVHGSSINHQAVELQNINTEGRKLLSDATAQKHALTNKHEFVVDNSILTTKQALLFGTTMIFGTAGLVTYKYGFNSNINNNNNSAVKNAILLPNITYSTIDVSITTLPTPPTLLPLTTSISANQLREKDIE